MPRMLLAFFAVLTLLVAACGDDDESGSASGSGGDTSGETTDGGADSDGSGGDSAGPSSGAGGSVTIGDETIALSASRCFLEEQEAAGQQILATAQADGGTNVAGEEVLVDFTRFGEESDFAGDDISVTVGDPFDPDSSSLSASLDIGAVSIDGSTVSATGFEFTDDELNSVAGAFEVNC